MRFEFATATRIVFGSGTLSEVAPMAAGFGTRAFVVVGHDTRRAAALLEYLSSKGMGATVFSVTGEPTTSVALEGAKKAVEARSDVIISFGGGSVIDAGKAIAALITNGGEPLDYLEVIGQGKPISKRSAPFIAIPTTAGTGAEVTRNAVLASTEHKVKVIHRQAKRPFSRLIYNMQAC